MSENTKERSLEKLFGTRRNVRQATDGDKTQGSPAGADGRTKAAARGTHMRASQRPAPSEQSKSSKGGASSSGNAAATLDQEDVGPGGYLGKGRYKRGDGVLVKPSIYMRPDQARALRMSAAGKDDPNGETMSEIIQSLLDQNGYCDPKHRP